MTVLRFSTKQFDISTARKPTINPIYGHSLAELLRQEFKSLGHTVEPSVEEEDWGWYFHTDVGDQTFMVGTCAYIDIDEETENPIMTTEPVEHAVQFKKRRSLKEILFRQNKFTKHEPIIDLTESILKRIIPDMTEYSKGL